MSLFNVCNWWSTQCTDLDDNYDVANLLCTRFGLDDNEKDYIVVGSHFGHLSIFYPSHEVERIDGSGNGYKPTDLLLEMCLSASIIGVYSGRFSANCANENSNQLVILHPTSVVVYNLQTVNGVAEHGTQLRLQQLSEYKFQRVAYTLCKGHFGQVKGREFFAIVHLDGSLSFYEQDGISYECQFPGHRSLPAPIAYCERTDSFLRFNANWNLECFTGRHKNTVPDVTLLLFMESHKEITRGFATGEKVATEQLWAELAEELNSHGSPIMVTCYSCYQDLSHSSINKSHYQPVWSVCLGEGILDMCVVQVKEESASIQILGERNFISLHDNGKVNFILKLDYAPKCFHCFVIGYYWEPTARLITGIISDNGRLFVYDNSNIIWAAQYQDEAPVAMQRSNINGLPGAIVTLGGNGQLRIGYLGSDPYQFKVPPLNMQEISFEQAHKELMQLEDEIKESVDVRDMESLNRRAAEDVSIDFTISSEITHDLDALLLDVSADVALKELPSSTGRLRLKCRVDLAELQFTFNLPEGIRCSQESLTYVDISAGRTEVLDLEFYIAELLHIHTARVEVIVSFISQRGIPRVLQKEAYLPLTMFFKVKQAQKAALIKMTYSITTKAVLPKLSTFFPEFLTWESEAQALGLELLCPGDEKTEEIITIVAAKNSNRLRLQSETLETFPMILERLINKALQQDANLDESKHKKGQINRKTLSIMAAPVIPVQQILSRIDIHRETQESILDQTCEIDALWDQFKSLQRKLQEKSDDEPKETLVMQIEENYDQLIVKGDKLMEIRKAERRHRCDLSCAISVAKWIISTLPLEEKLVNIICSVLCSPVVDWTETSWEESMSPGIDMLHHYGPLTRSKHPSTNDVQPANGPSVENFDYNRFRRHFIMLFERIIHLATSSETSTSKVTEGTNNQQRDENQITLAKGTAQNVKANAVKNVTALKQHMFKPTTLESVEDDEDEAGDEDDLSKAGYKKEYGLNEKRNENECSDWVNEHFELPNSEELFSDLGIWW